MLKITLVRSVIGNTPTNRRTIAALGLKKTGRTVYRQDTPSVRGMVRNVAHLLKVETVDAAPDAKPKAKPRAAAVEPKAAPKTEKPKAPEKKPATPKQPAAKKPAPKKADTDRKAFAEIGKTAKKAPKKKES